MRINLSALFISQMKILNFLIALLTFASVTQAQDKFVIRYANTITIEDAFKRLSILASDEFEGRETGKAGAQKAAAYIESQFKEFGLTAPVNNSYFQRLDLKAKRPIRHFAKLNGKDLGFLKDFYVLPGNFPNIKASFKEFVFVGYGISADKYDDLSALNLEGKVAIIIPGEPWRNGKSLITGTTKHSIWTTNLTQKLEALQAKKPVAIILVDEQINRLNSATHSFNKKTIILGEDETSSVPTIYFSATSLNKLLKPKSETLASLKNKIDTTGKPFSFNFQNNLSIDLQSEITPLEADNVMGYLEGSDPILKNEIIVITAHYDHLGIGDDGKIYNGADDDASGTTATLQIAEAFSKAKKEGNGPKRSILFMTVVGEEKGLLGSKWYADNPVFPLKNTITNLNIDMIGRVGEHYKGNKDSINYVYVIGSEKLSSTLKQISETANQTYSQLVLDYKYDDPADPNRFYYRSDHYNFAKHNIPIIFYFNGIHEDYHKKTDEIGKINFQLLTKRTQLIFYTAWELANRALKPAIDRAIYMSD